MKEFIAGIQEDAYLQKIITNGVLVVQAIFILVVGFWISKQIRKYLIVFVEKKGIDPSVGGFLTKSVVILLKTVVVLIAVNTIGIEVTSILAIIGGATLGLGMGLQGGLSNFAAGVMIISTKPFKVGDLIQSGDNIGYVKKINFLNTAIRSVRNEVITLPNAPLFGNPLHNYSEKEYYRIDIFVGLEYKSDIEKFRPLLIDAIQQDDLFLKDQPVRVEIDEFLEDRLKLVVRAFVHPKDYWEGPLRLHGIVNKCVETHSYKVPISPREIYIQNNHKNVL